MLLLLLLLLLRRLRIVCNWAPELAGTHRMMTKLSRTANSAVSPHGPALSLLLPSLCKRPSDVNPKSAHSLTLSLSGCCGIIVGESQRIQIRLSRPSLFWSVSTRRFYESRQNSFDWRTILLCEGKKIRERRLTQSLHTARPEREQGENNKSSGFGFPLRKSTHCYAESFLYRWYPRVSSSQSPEVVNNEDG